MSTPAETSAIIKTYDEFYERYTKLEAVADHGHPAVRDTLPGRYHELHEQFMHALHTRNLTSSDEVRRANAEADAEERALAAVTSELEALQELPPVERGAPLPPAIACKDPHSIYYTEVAEIYGQLALARAVFKSVCDRSDEDLRDEKVSVADTRFANERQWAEREEALCQRLRNVEQQGRQLGLPMPASLAEERRMADEVHEEGVETLARLRRAALLREDRDAQLSAFYKECAKLCQWCRQQLANLDTMEEPDHVQEYCGTLVENYATMSSNFNLLLEHVQPYVKANFEPVRRALQEANELWYYLQVTALERLSRTLFEIHPRSPLETEVLKYADYPELLKEFVEDVRGYIHTCAVTGEGNDMLLECDEFSPVLQSHGAVGEATRHFAERARIGRDSYRCFREALLSRLTFVTPPDHVLTESRHRQTEFESCVKELKQWAADTAHGESWRDIYAKIVEIKRMIKQEQEQLDVEAVD